MSGTHPRDHILCQAAALAPTMTDVTKVSVKVRVNGGAATTYSSTSSPAVAQAQDCPFGYHVEHPVNSFADGDRVSRAWLYNNVPVNGCYGDTIIGPADVDGAHYTTARGDKLDELDVAVGSRLAASDYIDPDNADIAAIKAELDALRGDYTSGRAVKLDDLDAAVSSRLAAVDYVVPDNADVAAVLALLGVPVADTIADDLATIIMQTAAAAVRDALGLAAADLDAQLAPVANLPDDPASESAVEAAITTNDEATVEQVWSYHDRVLTSFDLGDASPGYPDRADLTEIEVVE